MEPSVALRQLIPTTLVTNAIATYYTSPFPVPSNSVTKFTAFILANTDSSPRSLTGYNIPNGGTAATSNIIFPAVAIPANTVWIATYKEGFLVVPCGGFLQFVASVTNVITITFAGEEVQS